MRKFSNWFYVIVIVIMITSCSSNGEKIQDKWWYEVERVGDDIIKFTSDGKIKNINDRADLSYEIDEAETKLKLRDYEVVGEDETWTISSVTDNELILKNGDKSKTFRLATDQDFFIGKWVGTKQGVEVSFRFNKKNEVEIDLKGAGEEEYTYSFNDNKIVIDNEPLEFTLSEDKNNLILKGKETLNLIRRGI